MAVNWYIKIILRDSSKTAPRELIRSRLERTENVSGDGGISCVIRSETIIA